MIVILRNRTSCWKKVLGLLILLVVTAIIWGSITTYSSLAQSGSEGSGMRSGVQPAPMPPAGVGKHKARMRARRKGKIGVKKMLRAVKELSPDMYSLLEELKNQDDKFTLKLAIHWLRKDMKYYFLAKKMEKKYPDDSVKVIALIKECLNARARAIRDMKAYLETKNEKERSYLEEKLRLDYTSIIGIESRLLRTESEIMLKHRTELVDNYIKSFKRLADRFEKRRERQQHQKSEKSTTGKSSKETGKPAGETERK